MFGWEFPPHIAGGLGTACYGLTQALSRQDVEVIFVVPKSYGDEDSSFLRIVNASDVDTPYGRLLNVDSELARRLKVIEIDSSLVPYVSAQQYEDYAHEHEMQWMQQHRDVYSENWHEKYAFSGRYGATLMEEVARYAVVAAEVARLLEGQFDLIHVHDWLTYYAGMAARRVSGKPLVAHIHATEYDRSGDNINPAIRDIEQEGMSNADLVIAVSDLTRRVVIEKYGIDPSKVHTVHNGVLFDNKLPEGADVKHPLMQDKIVTFLGRITHQKGPQYFVEAAAKVLARVPGVRFVMAGNGDMFDQMVTMVANLGIADRFHFTGFLKGDQVQRMFLMSDVYVMPSVSEPFGISPLEAMKSHVPVIISKQSGVAEVLKYAVKIDYWDVDAMADAIYGLISYPALSKLFREKGSVEVDNLKWDLAATKVIELYKQVLKS